MKATEVAKHIINFCISKNNPINNLQLQNMLYFVDMYYLINTKKRLIDDNDFIAWAHYPIIKEVYYKYSKYALCDITTWEDFEEMLPDDMSGLIYGYIKKLSNILPSKLVEESSKENTPYDIVCNAQNKMYWEIPTYLMIDFANRMRKDINLGDKNESINVHKA